MNKLSPTFFAALSVLCILPAAQEAAAASVTVTLVRWPYT